MNETRRAKINNLDGRIVRFYAANMLDGAESDEDVRDSGNPIGGPAGEH